MSFFTYALLSNYVLPVRLSKSLFVFSAEEFGLTSPDYFAYLNQSNVYKVDGTNDAHEFQETLRGGYSICSYT